MNSACEYCFTAAFPFSATAAFWRFSSSAIASWSTSGCEMRYSRTMVSISLRWGAENSAARAMNGVAAVTSTAPARTKERGVIDVILVSESLASISEECLLGRLKIGDVVGAHPGGRADLQARLGPGGKLAGGHDVAAAGGGLRGGKVGLGQIAAAAISHGELVIGVGNVVIALEHGLEQRHRLGGERLVAGRDHRLGEQGVDEGGVVRELRGATQRRDRLVRLAALEQRLPLELVEIGIARLRLNELVDLRD